MNIHNLVFLLMMATWGSSFVRAETIVIQGDAQAGKAKSATCAACHLADGNSKDPIYPILAGQHASYIEKQLLNFKTGERENALMAPMAAPLSEQDRADLAAYFSKQQPQLFPVDLTQELIQHGEALYRGGDRKRGIPACLACHGPRGDGLVQAKYPRISAQHPQYVKSQLELFRAGKRANDPNTMMRLVAAKLTDRDIDALSKYVVGLH